MSPARAAFLAALVAAVLPTAALGQRNPSYEPQQRLRTSLDTCRKTEVMREAYCVQKCAPGFRMEGAGRKTRCVGLRADAKYEPPKPSYRPPAPDATRRKPAQGGMG